jgi:hypothetical protein
VCRWLLGTCVGSGIPEGVGTMQFACEKAGGMGTWWKGSTSNKGPNIVELFGIYQDVKEVKRARLWGLQSSTDRRKLQRKGDKIVTDWTCTATLNILFFRLGIMRCGLPWDTTSREDTYSCHQNSEFQWARDCCDDPNLQALVVYYRMFAWAAWHSLARLCDCRLCGLIAFFWKGGAFMIVEADQTDSSCYFVTLT